MMYGHWDQQTIHHPDFNKSSDSAVLSTHPTDWSKDDVWLWLKWCSSEYAIEHIPPEKFNMNGKAMCLLSRDDFKERWPNNGDVLYNALQRLTQNAKTSTVITHSPTCNQCIVSGNVKSRDQGAECRLLWEFLYQLLQCPTIYTNVICWENKQELVFRVVNPTELAELWGHEKNRTNMTYEKLSRALRYYYGTNIIKKVDGKRLTYRFMQQPECIQKGQSGTKPCRQFHATDGHSRKTSGEAGSADTYNNGPEVTSTSRTEAMAKTTNQQLRNYLCNKQLAICSKEDHTLNHVGECTSTSPYKAPVSHSSALNEVIIEVQSEPEDLSTSTLHICGTSNELEPSVNTNDLNSPCLHKMQPTVLHTFDETNS